MDDFRLGFHPERLTPEVMRQLNLDETDEVMQQLDLNTPALLSKVIHAIAILTFGTLTLGSVGVMQYLEFPTKTCLIVGAATLVITSPLVIWGKATGQCLGGQRKATWTNIALPTDPGERTSIRFINTEASSQVEIFNHLHNHMSY